MHDNSPIFLDVVPDLVLIGSRFFLGRYRDMHGISPKEHKELLNEYEWREEEFEAGFQKGVAPRDGSEHFLAYEALVRRELAKGEVRLKTFLVRPSKVARYKEVRQAFFFFLITFVSRVRRASGKRPINVEYSSSISKLHVFPPARPRF